MPFDKGEFELAMVKMLTKNGWDPQVLAYLTEEDLLQNLADFNNEPVKKRNRIYTI